MTGYQPAANISCRGFFRARARNRNLNRNRSTDTRYQLSLFLNSVPFSLRSSFLCVSKNLESGQTSVTDVDQSAARESILRAVSNFFKRKEAKSAERKKFRDWLGGAPVACRGARGIKPY